VIIFSLPLHRLRQCCDQDARCWGRGQGSIPWDRGCLL